MRAVRRFIKQRSAALASRAVGPRSSWSSFAGLPARLGPLIVARTTSAAIESPLVLIMCGVVATTTLHRLSSAQQRAKEAEAARPAAADEAAPESESAPEPAATLEEAYEVGEVLGHGHFATVRRGKHRATGEPVAIKEILKTRTDVDAIRREVAILRKVGSHPHIVALRDVYETEEGWYLVMELVTGGELFERLVSKGAYSEKEASVLLRQMGEAIAYLHSRGVCHRDLKPENLLLGESKTGETVVKICDFGLSVALEKGSTLSDKQGTWAYWAPEMFSAARYGKEVDMWSLGIILYIILSGRHPFDDEGLSDAAMRARIRRGAYDFEGGAWGHVSSEARGLIRDLLQHDPSKRLGAEALLSHEWVVGTGVSEEPISGSDVKLGEYQRMRRKWRAALVLRR